MNYTITINNQFNSKEIYFESKPEETIREALKTLKFRWNRKKSCWYGFATEEEIKNAIENDPVAELGGVASDGYMGAIRWDGNKSHQFLYGAELTAALRADAKRIGLKGVTFRVHTYSGGQSVTATIKASESDFLPFEEVKGDYLEETFKSYWFTMPDGTEKHRDSFESFNSEEFLTAQEITAKKIYEADHKDGARVNHYYVDNYYCFTASFRSRINLLLSLLHTYNYDDSNGMVDYFDTNFYYDIEIKRV